MNHTSLRIEDDIRRGTKLFPSPSLKFIISEQLISLGGRLHEVSMIIFMNPDRETWHFSPVMAHLDYNYTLTYF